MNVFYEDSGSFKVGCIVSKGDASFQVDTLHGKRAKIKAANVFLEFSSELAAFLPEVESLCATLDLDFLWECCGEDEFGFDDLARDYWGHAPSALEAAARADERVQALLEGVTVVKVVAVPEKLINFVVK